jgi:5-methylcytosine-specific restriction endonuclease McrA
MLLRLERCVFGDGQSMADEEWLRRALAPSTKRTRARTVARKVETAKRQTKREARDGVYAAVDRRAGGRCEACGHTLHSLNPGEHDHFWGRARAETVESVWLCCRQCHREKTENRPSRATWLRRFIRHAGAFGYGREVRKAEAVLASLADVEAARGVMEGVRHG